MDDRIVIVGESGDRIEITRAEFATSHYAEQGYVEAPVEAEAAVVEPQAA
jgi:hypothetical protein